MSKTWYRDSTVYQPFMAKLFNYLSHNQIVKCDFLLVTY